MLRSNSLQRTFICILTCIILLSLPDIASAAVGSGNVYDKVLTPLETAAKGWGTIIQSFALRLFWGLLAISVIWTIVLQALKQAEIGEIFAELFRQMIFFGIFLFFLTNAVSGFNIAGTIIDSLKQVAGTATGYGTELYPSSVVDYGFNFLFVALDQASMGSPLVSLFRIVFAFIILLLFAIIGLQMAILLAESWILLYGGVFFLGFGGSRWTSEIAVNYIKTIAGIGFQFFAMILIIGVGESVIQQYMPPIPEAGQTNEAASLDIKEVAVLMVIVFILTKLITSVPPMVAGILTGATFNSSSASSFGAGAAFGAATMGYAMTKTGATNAMNAMSGAIKQSGGGAQAVGALWRAATGGGGGGSGGLDASDRRMIMDQLRGMDNIEEPAKKTSTLGNLARNAGKSISQNLRETTAGGKMASAIDKASAAAKNSGIAAQGGDAKPEFDMDYMAKGKPYDPKAEADYFINRPLPPKV